jgi:hypothetical protein
MHYLLFAGLSPWRCCGEEWCGVGRSGMLARDAVPHVLARMERTGRLSNQKIRSRTSSFLSLVEIILAVAVVVE